MMIAWKQRELRVKSPGGGNFVRGRFFSALFAALFVFAFLLVLLPSVAAQASQDAFGDPTGKKGASAATGDLVAVAATVDGGTISIGASAQVVVLFRNDSGRPLTTGAIQLYPSSTVSATVSLNQCGQEELESGAVCAVSISVKALQPGTWRIDMLMRHSGRARLVTTSLTGKVSTGEGGAAFLSDIEAIPDKLSFGSLTTSQPIVKSVLLRNSTSSPIEIKSIYIEAAQQAGYSVRTDCSRLDPGQACVVTVTWSPILAGEAAGILVVQHTGPTTVTSVNLDGKFAPTESGHAEIFPRAVPGKGLIVASQDKIDFGPGVASTSAITVSLVNVGDAPVAIQEIRLASSDNGISIMKKGCDSSTVLQPVEACPLTLSWSPVREGSVLDDVHIVHDGARGVLVLPVRGTAAKVISQDSKAVRLVGGGALGGGGAGQDVVIKQDSGADPASALDGFVITSLSPTRGIISGPGGSRIVLNRDSVVIGGVLWTVHIRTAGIEFRSSKDKVLLLFDRSLSSVNRTSGQSGSGSGAASVGSAAASATPAAAASAGLAK